MPLDTGLFDHFVTADGFRAPVYCSTRSVSMPTARRRARRRNTISSTHCAPEPSPAHIFSATAGIAAARARLPQSRRFRRSTRLAEARDDIDKLEPGAPERANCVKLTAVARQSLAILGDPQQ
ncbi:hypothetical protein ACQP0C_17980 [Nocardia sp. CA-129566]|uniref:hypothetical protein n=1 Tax=Nocardia sp. CA-129566 TaxID=3239976 RepID=UPI003D951C48